MLKKFDWDKSSLDDFRAKLGKLSNLYERMGGMD
jgi:hypothetical protein